MKVDDLIKHYKTQAAAAAAIEVTAQAVSKWKQAGIPIDYQIKWELESRGALRADLPPEIRSGQAIAG